MSGAIQIKPSAFLVVVIVNYRTAKLTIECLRSLAQEIQSLSSIQVYIVDNDSQDGSVEQLAATIATEGWQDWVFLLPSACNGGYAFGNNLVIRQALQSENPPPYFLLLNPDTRVYPGALRTLVDFMEQHSEVGIAGSELEEADGTPFATAFRFPSILSELDAGLRLGIITKLLSRWVVAQPMNDRQAQVDWLPGACMIIRREVFETVGLMDEGYFLYFEETDFCLQARRAGWTCWYVPQSRVLHIAGQSTGVTVRNQRPKRLPQYWFDSRRRYFVKNHGLFYAALADLIWLISFSLWSVRRIIQRKPNPDPPYLLRDFIQNSVFFRGGLPQTEKKASLVDSIDR